MRILVKLPRLATLAITFHAGKNLASMGGMSTAGSDLTVSSAQAGDPGLDVRSLARLSLTCAQGATLIGVSGDVTTTSEAGTGSAFVVTVLTSDSPSA